MKDGFIRVCAATPQIRVADCVYNENNIIKIIEEAYKKDTAILVLPELCVTGYTCGDLFWQEALINGAKETLHKLAESTKGMKMLVFVGTPFIYNGKLYNVAVAINDGKIIGIVPKKNLPNYAEFYEKRHFVEGFDKIVNVEFDGYEVPFGSKLLFRCSNVDNLTVAAELCEDVWAPAPPSIAHALAGATVIVNCSASDEIAGKDKYRRALISGQSARLVCGYVYANAGEGESTQDLVFGGHNLICENGNIVAESKRFENECIYSEIDLGRIAGERRRMTTFSTAEESEYTIVSFEVNNKDLVLSKKYDKMPFVPSDMCSRDERCKEILTIQALGLKKRLAHTNSQSAVIGISGGLDSTLALLVMARAFDMLGLSRDKITAVTMPCFGTTDRTYNNAVELTKGLGAALLEVDIKESVLTHFKDIGQDVNLHDVTYENAQARERTQVLMDIANKTNGLVVGTGDLSELALGWATYNGDHMSMYGVNGSIPKTLVRYLVKYYAETCNDNKLAEILLDILDTPVSPELLPPEEGKISQKTEDLVGPYELHDFFMYYILRFGYMPHKVFRLACNAFEGDYEKDIIYKWLRTFYWRFFGQQFKRSCLPDGPKVGTVAVSPRGDLRMPSDATRELWMADLDKLKFEF